MGQDGASCPLGHRHVLGRTQYPPPHGLLHTGVMQCPPRPYLLVQPSQHCGIDPRKHILTPNFEGVLGPGLELAAAAAASRSRDPAPPGTLGFSVKVDVTAAAPNTRINHDIARTTDDQRPRHPRNGGEGIRRRRSQTEQTTAFPRAMPLRRTIAEKTSFSERGGLAD